MISQADPFEPPESEGNFSHFMVDAAAPSLDLWRVVAATALSAAIVVIGPDPGRIHGAASAEVLSVTPESTVAWTRWAQLPPPNSAEPSDEASRRLSEEETREAEMTWLAAHLGDLAARYPGQWVAIDGSELVAHGNSLTELLSRARQSGYADPFITAVPTAPITNLYV